LALVEEKRGGMSPSKRQDLFDEEEDGDLLLGVNKDYAKRFQVNRAEQLCLSMRVPFS
jgi:hypothetical protein